MKWAAFIVSAIIHLLIWPIGPLLFPPDPPKPPPAKGGSKAPIKIMDQSKGPGAVCSKWYPGIGITYDTHSGKIVSVSKGLPADRAGIKAGDVFLSELPVDCPTECKIGDTVIVRWQRETVTTESKLTIARVCIAQGDK